MTLRVAHLSDLHFGEHDPAAAERLRQAILSARPDALAVSGDLTRDARPEEFAQALAFLRALEVPALVVPGNHDIPRWDLWRRFLAPRRRWRAAIGPDAPEVVLAGDAALVALDTTRRAQWHPDWSAGGVPPERAERLRAALRALAGRRCFVVAHHPLRHPPDVPGRRAPVRAAETLAMLAGERVEAVLSGHLHRSGVLPGAPPVILAPSALSPRLKGEGNGWNLIALSAEGFAVERQAT
ncbi:MAG: metallophosphoesterase [Acetobacteraceae bacterium]|nr:metallophosphoesterase [Acetobacteraceae bacterium]